MGGADYGGSAGGADPGAGIPLSLDPVSLIDAEIGILEKQHTDYTTQIEKNEGLSEEMLRVASTVFGSGYDPAQQKQNAMEIVEFTVSEGAGDPASMMNMLVDLDRQASQSFPKFDFVSRVWSLVQQIKAQRAIQKLSRGP